MSITRASHSFKNSALEGLNYPNKACVWHDMMSMLQLMLAPISMISKNITILPLLRYFPNSLHSKKILNRAVKLARCATLNSSLKKFLLEMKILNATQIDFSPLCVFKHFCIGDSDSDFQIFRLPNWQSHWLTVHKFSPAQRVLNHNKVVLECISPKWKFKFSNHHEMAWKSD